MRINQITSSSLGNVLEWLDFGLFIFLAPLIGKQFFPVTKPNIAVIAAFGVFAAGFVCRPIGGILFGHFGDKIGRAKPLRLSIVLITTTTFLVGLLPSYDSIGIMAPILFTLFRLIQGIAIGGEYSGIMTYLAESAPQYKRGFITSFAATGANLGFFIATLIILIMQQTLSSVMIKTWGWRFPFIFVGLIGSIISYYRLKLLETPAYVNLETTQQIQEKPLWTALRKTPKNLLKIFALNCMSATFYYVFFGYMPEYLQKYLDFSAHHAFLIESFALFAMLFLVPCMAILGDRIGRKKMLLITTSGMSLLALPCFYLLQFNTLPAVIIVLTIVTVLSSLDQGNTLATVVENCPMDVRYSGVAFSYNLSAAIFGGLSPLVVISLINTFNAIAPGVYIMFTASIGFFTVLLLPSHFENNLLATSTTTINN